MPSQLIKELGERNIKISFSKGKLKYSGPEEHIDENILSRLKVNKAKLLKHFWPDECWNMMPINTEGTLTPLSILHAGPANYPISDYLGKNRPFYGYFYIGSEGEKIKYQTVEEFADEYTRQLKNILPNGPYLLGGLSMGGHLAYEMAIKLQNEGHKVPLLILVDCGLLAYEPQIKYKSFIRNTLIKTRYLLKPIYRWALNIVRELRYNILSKILFGKLPKEQRNAYIIWRYDELVRKYKPTTEFKGKVLLFRASSNNYNADLLGWDKVCKDIKLVHFEGSHGAMYHDPNTVDFIKKNIKESIDEVENTE